MLLILLGLLLGCGVTTPSSEDPLPSVPTWTPVALLPAPTLPPPAPSPTPLAADTGWETLRPGLERRQLRFFAADGQLREELYVVRRGTGRLRFRRPLSAR